VVDDYELDEFSDIGGQILNLSTFEPVGGYNAGSFCCFVHSDDVKEKSKVYRMKDNIKEEYIANFNEEVPVEVVLDKSNHAGERQYRHGEENIISDEEIVEHIKRASKKILRAMILNSINIGDSMLVRDQQKDLNVVCMSARSGAGVKIIIITVMRKHGFFAKPGTKIVDI
jgi:hypothetical protein